MGVGESLQLPISPEESSTWEGYIPGQRMAPARQRTDIRKVLCTPGTLRPRDTKQEANLTSYPESTRLPNTREHPWPIIPWTQYYSPAAL